MLLHAKQVDPTLGNGETHRDILAGYLAQFARGEARHKDVGAQLHLVAGDAPGGLQLQRKFTILGRTHTEAQQFNVVGIWWLEPDQDKKKREC